MWGWRQTRSLNNSAAPLRVLWRFKEDVREVQSGFECGLTVEGYQDIKPDDQIEVYNKFGFSGLKKYLMNNTEYQINNKGE